MPVFQEINDMSYLCMRLLHSKLQSPNLRPRITHLNSTVFLAKYCSLLPEHSINPCLNETGILIWS